jgi:restriction system protein
MTDISEQGFSYAIPDLLVDQVNFSKVYVNYGVMEKETSFGIDMSIAELGLAKTLRSRDLDLLPGKVEATLSSWEKKYRRYLETRERERKEANIDELDANAASQIQALHGILAHTINVHDAIDWNLIKITGGLRISSEKLFEGGSAPKFINFDKSGQPISFEEVSIQDKPSLEDTKSEFGIFSQTFRGAAIREKHAEQTGSWTAEELQAGKANDERETQFKAALSVYASKAAAFEEEKRRNNQALEHIRERYQGSESKAVEEYCDLVLDSSVYPDYFPKNWLLEYLENSRTVVTNYEVPSPDQLPSVGSYKYDKNADQIVENALDSTACQQLYDSVVYQIAIRTIHEMFEGDVVNAIDRVVFNAVVTIVNRATGKSELRCIASASSSRDEFMEFDLARVDPQATFEHLGGVIGGSPADLTVIAPILDLEKTDKRFL